MSFRISRHGIVHVDEGVATIYVPCERGGRPTPVEVDQGIADRYRLATGDIAAGQRVPITSALSPTAASDECLEDATKWDEQEDEPASARGAGVPAWLASYNLPSERLVSIHTINGLPLDEADMRPYARRRHPSERVTPDRRIILASGPDDETGRILDFAAPLAIGSAGIVYGPHASGLTRTLRSVVAGALADSDTSVILLLLRARGEERTDWRRRFPEADVIACPGAPDGATPEQTLRLARLAMECAKRQAETGKHVLLAIDSLTALWGTMLEAESADAQAKADQSKARQRIREWMQEAGDFRGHDPLGGSTGGAITVVGTVWNQPIDPEAEEDREIHPHLRLLEHVLPETSWRIALSGELADLRLYPAIDVARCLSQYEEKLLPEEQIASLFEARNTLKQFDVVRRFNTLIDAVEATTNLVPLTDALLHR